VHEKLRIFSFGQYIVGNVVSLVSDELVRFKIEVGVVKKCTKMSTPFPMDFPHTPEHAVVIDDVIIIGRRLLCKYIAREARM